MTLTGLLRSDISWKRSSVDFSQSQSSVPVNATDQSDCHLFHQTTAAVPHQRQSCSRSRQLELHQPGGHPLALTLLIAFAVSTSNRPQLNCNKCHHERVVAHDSVRSEKRSTSGGEWLECGGLSHSLSNCLYEYS